MLGNLYTWVCRGRSSHVSLKIVLGKTNLISNNFAIVIYRYVRKITLNMPNKTTINISQTYLMHVERCPIFGRDLKKS